MTLGILGRLSDCPGYVGIVINNRMDLEELFRYDALIFCPAVFNITFKVTPPSVTSSSRQP